MNLQNGSGARVQYGPSTFWTTPYDYEFPSASFVASDGKRWSLTEPHSCIVGETHDRNTNHLLYGCEVCAGYATSLMGLRGLNWPEILSGFLDHYEKDHAIEVPA